jgi:hypothetical protein
MAESFYINLSLRELSAFKRVSFCAEAAYTHFKRNIDFATGKSNKTYSLYRLGRILSKPALGRGYPAETVSTKKARGAVEQLCQVGLLCFDFETLEFELPLHDKTPEKTPKNTDSRNHSEAQSRHQPRNQSRNYSGHKSKTAQTRVDIGIADDLKLSGNQSGQHSGHHSEPYSGHHSGHTDTPVITPTHKPTSTPSNKLSLYGDVPPPEQPEKEKPTPQAENLGGKPPIPPEAVATLPCTPPAPRTRGEIQAREGQQDDAQQWLVKRLKQAGFIYADNPKSQPYYMNWQRLLNAGKMDYPMFERVLADLLQTTQGAPTPRALDEAIKVALVGAAPQRRRALGRGDMVL